MSRLTKKMKHYCDTDIDFDYKFADEDVCVGEIVDKLGKLEDLEEELGCPLEVVIEHIKESYKMLCQHIEINEEYIKLGKCRDLEELVRRSDDIAISKEQKGLCEKYFTWLKEDKSE